MPTIIYDGRSPRDQHNNAQLVLNIDIAATILDYAGIPAPACMQGVSMRPLAEGKFPSWRTEFYYEHPYNTEGSKVYLPMCEGLVQQRYKYMRYFNGKDPDTFFYEELYDQVLDPFEVHNLSNSPGESVLKDRMIRTMKSMRKELK